MIVHGYKGLREARAGYFGTTPGPVETAEALQRAGITPEEWNDVSPCLCQGCKPCSSYIFWRVTGGVLQAERAEPCPSWVGVAI